MFKKIITSMFLLAIVVVILCDIESHAIEISFEEYIENQARSLEIYEQLSDFLRYSAGGRADEYPNFFGGVYIDENGNLVILIFSAHGDTSVEALMDAFSMEGVSFRFVAFPVSYLESLNEKLIEIIPPFGISSCIYTENITSWGIDDRANRVFVGLEILNDEKIAGFREHVHDSLAISFRQEGRTVLYTGTRFPFLNTIIAFIYAALALMTIFVLIFVIKKLVGSRN